MFFYGPCYNFLESNLMLSPFTTFLQPMEYVLQKNADNSESEENLTSMMAKALEKKHQNSKSKIWAQQEDAMLIELVQKQFEWEEIAQRFQGKSQVVCKRRHKRLIKQSQKWPKQSQRVIKQLYQVDKLSWKQIQKFLPMYTKKQIKERYKNFLEVDIKRIKWTVQEDLKLWKLVKQYGNSWVKFTKLLDGRSQLQLKNRYNKFIKPVEQSLFQREQPQNHESDSEYSME